MRPLGIALFLLGLPWALQGAGLVGGSFIGIVTGAAGAAVVARAGRRRPRG